MASGSMRGELIPKLPLLGIHAAVHGENRFDFSLPDHDGNSSSAGAVIDLRGIRAQQAINVEVLP